MEQVAFKIKQEIERIQKELGDIDKRVAQLNNIRDKKLEQLKALREKLYSLRENPIEDFKYD